MVLYGLVWSCKVVYYLLWSCIILYNLVWVLLGSVDSSMVLYCLASSSIVLYGPPWSCKVLYYRLAWSKSSYVISYMCFLFLYNLVIRSWLVLYCPYPPCMVLSCQQHSHAAMRNLYMYRVSQKKGGLANATAFALLLIWYWT